MYAFKNRPSSTCRFARNKTHSEPLKNCILDFSRFSFCFFTASLACSAGFNFITKFCRSCRNLLFLFVLIWHLNFVFVHKTHRLRRYIGNLQIVSTLTSNVLSKGLFFFSLQLYALLYFNFFSFDSFFALCHWERAHDYTIHNRPLSGI